MEDLPLSALRRRFIAVGLGLGSLSVRQDEATMIPEVEVLGAAFLGPHALATFISAIEMGIIIACFARFLARSEGEKMRIKVLVYFLTFVAMFQTGTTFAAWWKISVRDYGNWSAAAVPAWPQKIHSMLTTLLAAPIQLFLIWRCWILVKRRWRWLVVLPLVLLVIGTIVTTVYVTVVMFLLQFKSKHTKALSLGTFFTCFVLSLAFSAVVDIAVTSILLVFLMKSRSKIYTRKFRRVLSQLITITWESAVPPCACAIAALVACVIGKPFVSYWAVMLQVILGKLYLISLFVILEGRAHLASVNHLTHFPTLTNATERDGAWSDQPDEAGGHDPLKQPSVPLKFVSYRMDMSNDTSAEEGVSGPDSSQNPEMCISTAEYVRTGSRKHPG